MSSKHASVVVPESFTTTGTPHDNTRLSAILNRMIKMVPGDHELQLQSAFWVDEAGNFAGIHVAHKVTRHFCDDNPQPFESAPIKHQSIPGMAHTLMLTLEAIKHRITGNFEHQTDHLPLCVTVKVIKPGKRPVIAIEAVPASA